MDNSLEIIVFVSKKFTFFYKTLQKNRFTQPVLDTNTQTISLSLTHYRLAQRVGFHNSFPNRGKLSTPRSEICVRGYRCDRF